jgi:hypothetical protein
LTHIFNYEKEKLIDKFNRLTAVQQELESYFVLIRRLKERVNFFGMMVEKNAVRKAVMTLCREMNFNVGDENDSLWKFEVTKFLCRECWGDAGEIQREQLSQLVLRIFNWLHAQKIAESPVSQQKLKLSFETCGIPAEFQPMFIHFFTQKFDRERT